MNVSPWFTVISVILIMIIIFIPLTGFGLPTVNSYSYATVTFTTQENTIEKTVPVADTPYKQYIGLGQTPQSANSGMLFIFETPENRTFVMRGVDYPIDIIFVDSDGLVTSVHHAKPESFPGLGWMNRYNGYAKYVIEVPSGYAEKHSVEPGTHVKIDALNEVD